MRKSNLQEFSLRFSRLHAALPAQVLVHLRNLAHRRILILPIALLLLLVSCTEDDGPITPPTDPGISEIEARVLTLVNQYRVDNGYAPLTRNDIIDAQARKHSTNMAAGSVPFSHDGFEDRVNEIRKNINIGGAGENVAMNSGYSDPARVAFDGWIKSDGHRANIEGNYDLTGIGVAQSSSGAYYLTQIFAKSR
ncbi:MAG: CAP domain-containing protein [Bacteroidetes bacterium]|nr:CAP domain-containing protein [Bacteroidota bacterium]